jgi:hypothetical protein
VVSFRVQGNRSVVDRYLYGYVAIRFTVVQFNAAGLDFPRNWNFQTLPLLHYRTITKFKWLHLVSFSGEKNI